MGLCSLERDVKHSVPTSSESSQMETGRGERYPQYLASVAGRPAPSFRVGSAWA